MLCFRINNFHATVNCHLVKSFTIVYNKHYQLIQEEMFESVVVLFIVVAQGWMITEKDYQKDGRFISDTISLFTHSKSLQLHLASIFRICRSEYQKLIHWSSGEQVKYSSIEYFIKIMYLLPEDKNVLKLRTNCSSYKSSLAYHLSNVKLLLGCISFTSTFSNSEIWLLFIYQCSIINHHKIIFTIIWYNRWSQQLCILVLMSADTLSGLFIGLGFKNYAKLIPHMLKSIHWIQSNGHFIFHVSWFDQAHEMIPLIKIQKNFKNSS